MNSLRTTGKRLIPFAQLFLVLGCATAIAQPEVQLEFITEFGGLGGNPGEFGTAVGIDVDDEGRIFVTDNDNHRFQVCDLQGNCEVFGHFGTGPRQFTYPIGIAVDSQGRIAVSDGQNFRIHLWSPDGSWTAFGENGSAPGQFRIPGGLAIDRQDRIIVADENNDRVQICEDTGICTAFGGFGTAPGKFITARAVAIDSQDRIVVSDWDNHRIQVCTELGDCTTFGQFGKVAGRFDNPTELAVDRQDRVIIADRDNHRIQICDLAGACVTFGSFGTGPMQFNHPTGIAVDSGNRIYVADRDNQRVQVFQAVYGPLPLLTVQKNCTSAEDDGLFNVQVDGVEMVTDLACGESSAAMELAVGDHVLVETAGTATDLADYLDPVYGGDCDAEGNIYLADGDDKTCTITNSRADDPPPGPDFIINAGLNDAWFNASTAGQGFFFTVFPDVALFFLAWFTFDSERPDDNLEAILGEPYHRWVTAIGTWEANTVTLDVELTTGGVLDSADPPAQQVPGYGSITIEFHDCNSASLSYELEGPGLNGQIDLTRVVADNIILCESLATP